MGGEGRGTTSKIKTDNGVKKIQSRKRERERENKAKQ